MRNSELELAVCVAEVKMMTGRDRDGPSGARENVLSLMTILDADGARLIGVPDIVIAEPPGNNVWEPMINSAFEFAVMIEDPNVIEGSAGRAGDGLARLIVVLPMMISDAEGARLIFVPDNDIAGPPGTSVCPDMTN